MLDPAFSTAQRTEEETTKGSQSLQSRWGFCLKLGMLPYLHHCPAAITNMGWTLYCVPEVNLPNNNNSNNGIDQTTLFPTPGNHYFVVCFWPGQQCAEAFASLGCFSSSITTFPTFSPAPRPGNPSIGRGSVLASLCNPSLRQPKHSFCTWWIWIFAASGRLQ